MKHSTSKPACTRTAATPALVKSAKHTFRVHAHLQVPVAAQIILPADTPQEAYEMAAMLLQSDKFRVQLHGKLGLGSMSVPLRSDLHVNTNVESALDFEPPEVFLWDIVDVNSGKHYGPVLQSLLGKRSNKASSTPLED